MSNRTPDDARPVDAESYDDDCGHSLDELDDFLVSGSSPYEAHYRECPQCQAGLASLRSLSSLTRLLAEEDAREAAESDGWLQDILSNLRLETRAGRSIPVHSHEPDDGLSVTEGAVVALIRSTGDEIDGVTIGKCRLHGEITEPGAETRVELSVTALHGYRLPTLVENLRQAVTDAFITHTELVLTGIDITVADLLELEDDSSTEDNSDTEGRDDDVVRDGGTESPSVGEARR